MAMSPRRNVDLCNVHFRITRNNAGHKVSETVPANVDVRRVIPLEPLTLSGGKNTVLFDDMGMPSIVFPFAKQKYSDLMEGGTQETFPCFRIENEEKDVIYISKFLNIVVNDRAYSLPMKDPRPASRWTVCRSIPPLLALSSPSWSSAAGAGTSMTVSVYARAGMSICATSARTREAYETMKKMEG